MDQPLAFSNAPIIDFTESNTWILGRRQKTHTTGVAIRRDTFYAAFTDEGTIGNG